MPGTAGTEPGDLDQNWMGCDLSCGFLPETDTQEASYPKMTDVGNQDWGHRGASAERGRSE